MFEVHLSNRHLWKNKFGRQHQCTCILFFHKHTHAYADRFVCAVADVCSFIIRKSEANDARPQFVNPFRPKPTNPNSTRLCAFHSTKMFSDPASVAALLSFALVFVSIVDAHRITKEEKEALETELKE